MSEEYFVPCAEAESEFTEKRSRFIGRVACVESEAEARAYIEKIKKQHYDARHNCWCYIVHDGGIVRYGDDGEPQGTAGQPMLNVFQLISTKSARFRDRGSAALLHLRAQRAILHSRSVL